MSEQPEILGVTGTVCPFCGRPDGFDVYIQGAEEDGRYWDRVPTDPRHSCSTTRALSSEHAAPSSSSAG